MMQSISIVMMKFLIKGFLMTNEIIAKYLDQQGITPGECAYEYDGEGEGFVSVVGTNIVTACYVQKEDALVYANSRKSLRDWIITALNLNDKAYEGDKWTSIELTTYQLATENIEASLSKPWSQVREELEGMEG